MDDSDSGIGLLSSSSSSSSSCFSSLSSSSSASLSSLSSLSSSVNSLHWIHSCNSSSMSSSGDERSAAGSRSSVASIPLSEVASSPIPASLTNNQHSSSRATTPRGVPTPPTQQQQQQQQQQQPPQQSHHHASPHLHQPPESQVRHIHSVQHHPLINPCLPTGPTHHPAGPPYMNLPVTHLLPPPMYAAEQWSKQGAPSPRDYIDEKHFRSSNNKKANCVVMSPIN